jgi:hypothetical protein
MPPTSAARIPRSLNSEISFCLVKRLPCKNDWTKRL